MTVIHTEKADYITEGMMMNVSLNPRIVKFTLVRLLQKWNFFGSYSKTLERNTECMLSGRTMAGKIIDKR